MAAFKHFCDCLEVFAQLPKEEWQPMQWYELASVLGMIKEYVQPHSAPQPSTSDNSKKLVLLLATLSRRFVASALPESDPARIHLPCSKQLLTCTTQLMGTAFLQNSYDDPTALAWPFSSGSGSNMSTADSLTLARQVTTSGLCPQLALAVNHAVMALPQLPQLHSTGLPVEESMYTCTVLLRLSLAIAAMWPGGILKSGTARCLAEPTVRMAVAVLQRMSAHHVQSGMRLDTAHDIATFSRHLVLEACRLLDSSSSSSSSGAESTSSGSSGSVPMQGTAASPVHQLAASGLQDSPEFLALTLLVLHVRLVAPGDGYLPNVTLQQQLLPPLQQAGVTEASLESLLEEQAAGYFSAVVRLLSPETFCSDGIQRCFFAVWWHKDVFWQQPWGAADLLLLLRLLQLLLQSWSARKTEIGERWADELQLVKPLLQQLPVVLLHVAARCWQQQEVVLFTAALEAAASTAALGLCRGNDGIVRVLLLQWLELVGCVLPHNSDAVAEAEPAAAALDVGWRVVPALLQVLAAVADLWCAEDCTDQAANINHEDGCMLLEQVSAALERIVRMHMFAAEAAAATEQAAAVEHMHTSAAEAAAAAKQAAGAAGIVSLQRCLASLTVIVTLSLQANVRSRLIQPVLISVGALRGLAAAAMRQQLASLLCSAFKLTEAANNAAADAADAAVASGVLPDGAGQHGASPRMLALLQETAHYMFLKLQHLSNASAAVRYIEPLAVPWLLLLVKVARRWALQLQAAFVAVAEACICLEQGQDDVVMTSRGSFQVGSLVLWVDSLADIAASATARLLDCLSIVAQEGFASVVSWQHPRRPDPSSSTAEGQQLSEVDAAHTELNVLRRQGLLLLCFKYGPMAAAFCGRSAACAAAGPSSSSSGMELPELSTAVTNAQSRRGLQVLAVAMRSETALQQLPEQLLALVDRLCAALPVSCCCNNPGCANLAGSSEQQLVAGKGCICARCRTARYCCKGCQEAHWQQHKPVCKRLKAAAAAAAAAATALS